MTVYARAWWPAFMHPAVLHYLQAVLLNIFHEHLIQYVSKNIATTSSKRKLRKYDSAIDTSCAFETNDLNLTTANFDSYEICKLSS
jgi:hypothetical protein